MCQEKKREFANIEDCVDSSIQGLEIYIKKSKERLITATKNNIGNINTDKKLQKLGNRNGKKNKCTDISSDKVVI